MSERVRRFTDPAAFFAAGLAAVARAAGQAVAARGRFLLALSGGATPLPLYAAMAGKGLGVPWDAVHFFFADERLVPTGDWRSTFGTVAPLLFLPTPIPVGNIHPMPATLRPPEQAAALYEEDIRGTCGSGPQETPRLDLLLLGLGPDGHTGSLLPHSPALRETNRLVVAVPPPTTAEPRVGRLTMTLPLINAARKVLFLVAGQGKEQALTDVLFGRPDPALPASLVRPQGGAGWLLLL